MSVAQTAVVCWIGAAALARDEFVISGFGREETENLRRGQGGVSLHVSPFGSDEAAGSADRPLRTLARAASMVKPGTTVLVAPGVYPGGLTSATSGAAGARIVYLSTTRWGARVVPPPRSAGKKAWDNRGDYVDIVGFDIDGSAHQDGVPWTHGIYTGGSYGSIRRNRVRHIAQQAPCISAGGSAIGADSYFGGIDTLIAANLVHDIGPAGCRFMHGIYMSTSGRVTNNVVYRVAEGAIHLWHDARQVVIAHNTVAWSNTGIIIGGGDFYRGPGVNDYTTVHGNIVYNNTMGISEQGRTGMHNSYRNNLVYRNSRYDWRLNNGLRHHATINAAPLFVDGRNGAAPDFRLQPGSPAIGRAAPANSEEADFDGRRRRPGARGDIGAHQH